MSRFYVSLKEKPTIRIEFTEDLKQTIAPHFEKLFGVQFLAAEEKKGDLLIYKFQPIIEDFELIENTLLKMAAERIVDDVDIDINLN